MTFYKKFGEEKRDWILQLMDKTPTLYLDEVAHEFKQFYGDSISKSTVCAILHEAGYSWKVMERRAIQIHQEDVARFTVEMLSLPYWSLKNLVFLDEAGIDRRDMFRNKGWAMIGEKLVCRGSFRRSARISILAFIGENGFLDYYKTEGTFTRLIFFKYLKEFAYNNRHVHVFPGEGSVWIMDGARIHCDKNIIAYFRAIGIYIIFLPAYCPFFNPIESCFAMIKRRLRKISRELGTDMMTVCNDLRNYSFTHLFGSCGYDVRGFNPAIGLNTSKNYVKGSGGDEDSESDFDYSDKDNEKIY